MSGYLPDPFGRNDTDEIVLCGMPNRCSFSVWLIAVKLNDIRSTYRLVINLVHGTAARQYLLTLGNTQRGDGESPLHIFAPRSR